MKTPRPREALKNSPPPDGKTVLKGWQRNPRGRTVYIGIRVRERCGKLASCKGLNIRAFDFQPYEVHRIILLALRAAADRAHAERRGMKLIERQQKLAHDTLVANARRLGLQKPIPTLRRQPDEQKDGLDVC